MSHISTSAAFFYVSKSYHTTNHFQGMVSVKGVVVMDGKKNYSYYKKLIHNNKVFDNSFGKIEYNKYNFRRAEESESSEIQEVKIYLNEGYNFEIILNEKQFYMQKANLKLEAEMIDNGKVVLRYKGNHHFKFLKPEDQITLVKTGELDLDISNYKELIELIKESLNFYNCYI